MEYLAHYDRETGEKEPLSLHLTQMGQAGERAIPPVVQFPKLPYTVLQKLCSMILHMHDAGKYTHYFQDYLRSGEETELKTHAHLSACMAYPFILDLLDELPDNLKYAWAYLSYLIIRWHHRSLEKVDGVVRTRRDMQTREWDRIARQIKHLQPRWASIFEDAGLMDVWRTSHNWTDDPVQSMRGDRQYFDGMGRQLTKRMKSSHWYFAFIYLFSVLIDQDKLQSAGIPARIPQRISYVRVDEYLHQKHGARPSTTLLDRRTKAKQSILECIRSLSDEQIRHQHLFTLTAPTGIGKTLASLQAALLLQERISDVCRYTPSLITAIPFVNIIEQTKRDYESIFGESARLIVHHRLADFTAESSFEDEKPLEYYMMETESWEGDVILTTFVQLFMSILNGKNRPLKKVNKLAGSIVILDEVQALPENYMPLLGAVLRKMADYYGTRFILMTATQPKLLELGDRLLGQTYIQPVELLAEYPAFFAEMTRTRLIPHLDTQLNTDEFLAFIQEKRQKDESTLIVVNTIRRSIEVFERLQKMQKTGELPERVRLFYLSTNIVPKQREKVIQNVKDTIGKQSVILVSTQTIEAGVDLDFDIGFRDLAPLTSIIQTAGRINREGKRGTYRPVYLVHLEKDCGRVYGLSNWQLTRQLLVEQAEVREPYYQQLIETYYSRLAESGISDQARQIWEEGILGLDFSVVEKFELIEQANDVLDIFVELDEEAEALADAYEAVKDERTCQTEAELRERLHRARVLGESSRISFSFPLSCYERNTLLKLVQAKLSRYIIQIRLVRTKENRPLSFENRNGVHSLFGWIPPLQITDYYDSQTGFKETGGASFF